MEGLERREQGFFVDPLGRFNNQDMRQWTKKPGTARRMRQPIDGTDPAQFGARSQNELVETCLIDGLCVTRFDPKTPGRIAGLLRQTDRLQTADRFR